MKKPDIVRFSGFSKQTLEFLKNLAANNSKPWLERHRDDYETHLMQPLRALVVELGDLMVSIDPYIETTPAVNKTISKIYRDTRFSRDKSLFKESVWVTFKRPGKDWKDAPAYFFELFSDWYRYGMGYYSASPATMSRFRNAINTRPKEFAKAIAFYDGQKTFTLEGEQYQRLFDADRPDRINLWYQKRSLYLVCNRKVNKRLFSRRIADDLADGFVMLAPLYRFLWKLRS
ncbi:MAG: DUF2461 domain-containing protein [Candidatus Zixiibacteriota bacterium]